MSSTMSVRMPDGVIIRGIPVGTPKAEIMARYKKVLGAPEKPPVPNLDQPDEEGAEPYRNPMPVRVGGLDEDQTLALMDTIGKRESSNNYKAENKGGYIGRYQFGAAALVDVGFVDATKYHTWRKAGRQGGQKAFLSDESNWLYTGGKKAWLADKGAQDEAIRDLLNENLSRLKKKRAIKKDTTPEDVAGYLMAAHLGGWSNAVKLANEGADFRDANNTSIKEYYELGKKALKQVGTSAAVQQDENKPDKQADSGENETPLAKLEDGTYEDNEGQLFTVKSGQVNPFATADMAKLDDGMYQDDAGDLFTVANGEVKPYVTT